VRSEDRFHLCPAELLDRLDGRGQARRCSFLSLRRTAEALAKQKLDRGHPRPHVRDLDLDSLLLAATGAGGRDPVRPRGRERSVEQGGRDVVEGSSRSLGKPRANLSRVGMTVLTGEGRLDLSDERLGHGALPPSRMVSASDSLLPDLFDHG
jgi:hypothetical protein